MGQQQSPQQKSPLQQNIQIPQSGYRITNLLPQVHLTSENLNILTDYVIDKDPRLLDLKQLYELNERDVEFLVFNILDYRVRKVKVQIRRQSIEQQEGKPLNAQEKENQGQANKTHNITNRKEFTLGINFKYYPKINDTILRISKIFKSSPLQAQNIKKDEYIVGILQGDFTSMKQFVELVKLLMQSRLEFITLGVCDVEGTTRLVKISVGDLVKWKQNYGVGYLGVELAQGWLNKWELKKNIEANKKKQLNQQSGKIIQGQTLSQKQSNSHQNLDQEQRTNNIQIQQSLNSNNQKINQSKTTKQEVDFFKQNSQITHDEQQKQEMKLHQQNKQKIEQKQKLSTIQQTSKTSLQQEQILLQQNQQRLKKNQTRISNTSPASQPEQQPSSSTSQVSSQQIEQKCQQLQHYYEPKKHDINVIKKTQNILEINFKDDASTICICKDYSKHCQKCFKEKQGNYYFFNKKTNKIILIEKVMLFPKKN